MSKVTNVQRTNVYSNCWDVSVDGKYNPEIDVHSKYVGGGRSVATVKVPLQKTDKPVLTSQQIDGIARRIDGRFRIVSTHIVRDVRGDHVIRSYAFNAND